MHPYTHSVIWVPPEVRAEASIQGQLVYLRAEGGPSSRVDKLANKGYLTEPAASLGSQSLIPLENSGRLEHTAQRCFNLGVRKSRNLCTHCSQLLVGPAPRWLIFQQFQPTTSTWPFLATFTHPDTQGLVHVLPKRNPPDHGHNLAQRKEKTKQQLHIIVVFASSLKSHSLGPATSPGQGHCTDDRRIAFHFFLYDLFQGPKKYSLESPGKWKLFPSTATHSLSLHYPSFPDQLSPFSQKPSQTPRAPYYDLYNSVVGCL